MPEVIFNGTGGRLEGRYHHSKAAERADRADAAHPLHGGTMNNRVVFALFRPSEARLLGTAVQFSGWGDQGRGSVAAPAS